MDNDCTYILFYDGINLILHEWNTLILINTSLKTDIIKRLGILIDSMLMFGRRVFQQMVEIFLLLPTLILLTLLFVWSRVRARASERKKEKKLSKFFNIRFRYIVFFRNLQRGLSLARWVTVSKYGIHCSPRSPFYDPHPEYATIGYATHMFVLIYVNLYQYPCICIWIILFTTSSPGFLAFSQCCLCFWDCPFHFL